MQHFWDWYKIYRIGNGMKTRRSVMADKLTDFLYNFGSYM